MWITETGGIVRHRRFKLQRGPRRAGDPPRLQADRRVPAHQAAYLYNWRYDGNKRWDSGLISEEGTERMAYYEFLDGLTLDPFKPLPAPLP